MFIGEGNGSPIQCSCLENPRDGRAWWAAVYGVAQSWTQLKQLSSNSSMMFTGLQEYLTRTGESTPKIYFTYFVHKCVTYIYVYIHRYIHTHICIYTHTHTHTHTGFPGGTSGKEPTCQCRRHKRCRFHSWVRKIAWRRYGSSLQYSCLENPMDRGIWQATMHGDHKESDTTEVT